MLKDLEKYRALGCDMRFRIMNILINGNNGLYVCEIATILKEKQYNISRHLSILKNASLIEEKREGKFVLYSALFTTENRSLFDSIRKINEKNDAVFKRDIDNMEKLLSERKKVKTGINC